MILSFPERSVNMFFAFSSIFSVHTTNSSTNDYLLGISFLFFYDISFERFLFFYNMVKYNVDSIYTSFQI